MRSSTFAQCTSANICQIGFGLVRKAVCERCHPSCGSCSVANDMMACETCKDPNLKPLFGVCSDQPPSGKEIVQQMVWKTENPDGSWTIAKVNEIRPASEALQPCLPC